ncbi:MAG: hypothetical protein ABI947_07370 [Chloroflexota bacterium]
MAQRTGNILNPARRMVVRLGLATGATLSVVLGAQTLALLDQHPTVKAPETPKQVQHNEPTAVIAVNASASNKVTDGTKLHAAPLIIVIRNPGAVTNAKVGVPASAAKKPVRSNIVPPVANIVAPNPVVLQAPANVNSGGGGGGASSQPAPVSAPSGK